MKVDSGIIFCIPLFMDKNDWELKSKLYDKDLEKDFAFGRVIETSSSVLVEIFKKIGSAHTELDEIVNSGVMFSPVQIFWDAIPKKRWRIIGRTEDYDRYRDSNYGNLYMVFGCDDDYRLRHFSTKEEKPILWDEIGNYEGSMVWFPIDLENRILSVVNQKVMPAEAK